MSCSYCWSSVLLLKWSLAFSALVFCATGNFYSYMDVAWGDGRAVIMDNGQALRLSLDRPSGSGCQSRKEFLFGKFDVKMKLVEGNSAGTVTAFYLKSQGSAFDEVDMEFLGNLSGDPYILHTNVYTQGQGNREQQFYLWFDPTKDFHTYSILWNQHHVMIYADGTPIREFRNFESSGVRFPLKQPMRVYSSLWNADQWATRGGLIKTDWSQAPFSATLRDIVIDGCTQSPNGAPICGGNGASMAPTWMEEGLVVSPRDQKRLAWVKKNYMVYDYCKQWDKFPQGLPKECPFAL